MNFKIIIQLLVISLLLLSSVSYAQKIADIKLQDVEGREHSIYEYIGQGKWLVVVVWGPKCPACIEEMPVIQMMYDDMDKKQFSVLGLVLDYPSFGYAKIKQVKEYFENNIVEFPNLLISAKIFDRLGIGRLEGTPTIMVLDPQGEVLAMQAGIIPRKTIEVFLQKQVKK